MKTPAVGTIALLLTLAMTAPFAASAQGLDAWQVRNPLPHANNLRAVAHGNGLHVAVGDAGTVLTSGNGGVTWTQQNSGITNTAVPLTSIAFGGGQFVALSLAVNTNVFLSTNGTNWTAQTVAFISGGFTSIAHGNGRFVLVGYRGGTNLIMSSPNGVAWSQHPTPAGAPATGSLVGVTFAQNLFVAVGGSGANGYIFTSPDGLNWTARRTNVPEYLVAVAGGNGFVATGNKTTISRSPDGVTWTDTPLAAGLSYSRSSLVFGNGVFAMLDWTVSGPTSNSRVYTSPDGQNWTQRYSGVGLHSLAFGGGQFTGAGSVTLPQFGTHGVILTSADGLDWNQQFSSGRGEDDLRRTYYAVATGLGKTVLGGGDLIFRGFTPSTADFKTWSGVFGSISGWPVRGVAYHGGLFVAVGGELNPEIIVSTNAVNWAPQASPGGGSLHAVINNTTRFVAVGEAVDGSGQVLTSADGINWGLETTDISAGLRALTVGNGALVAVGVGGVTARSADGTDWTYNPSGVSNELRGVTHASGQYVAVGDNGRILTSPDGVTWTPRTSGTIAPLNVVAFLNGRFLAAGDQGTVLTSANGVDWSRLEVPADADLRAFGIAANGWFVLTGNRGVILTSADGLAWVNRTISFGGLGSVEDEFFDAVSLNDTIYATSSGGAIWESRGGRNWYVRNSASQGLYAFGLTTYGSRLVVAGTVGSYFANTSVIGQKQDGAETWEVQNLGDFGRLNDVVRGGNQLVAVGNVSGGVAAIFTSPDGGTWTRRISPVTFELNSVDYGNGIFVAAGAGGAASSPDGINWTIRPGPAGEAVVFGGGKFAVGGTAFHYSSNGINWNNAGANGTTIFGMTYANGTFMAVGDGGAVFSSPDAINWTPRRLGIVEDFFTTVFHRDTFLVLGDRIAAVQSGLVATTLPSIVQSPADVSVAEASDALLSVVAAGRGPLFFQWFKDGIPLPGAQAPFLKISQVQAGDSGDYRVVVRSDLGSATSDAARLTVPGAFVSPASRTLGIGGAVTLTATVVGDTAVSYEWQRNGEVVTGATGSSVVLTDLQFEQAGEYMVTVQGSAGSYVASGTVSVVAVDLAPVDQTVTEGSYASINASLSGSYSESPLFTWRRNDVAITGGTAGLLEFTAARLEDGGTYTAVAVFPDGQVNASNAAKLQVNAVIRPRIAAYQLAADRLSIQFTIEGAAGQTYRIDYADALTEPVGWFFFDSVTMNSDQEIRSLDLTPWSHLPELYFRLALP